MLLFSIDKQIIFLANLELLVRIRMSTQQQWLFPLQNLADTVWIIRIIVSEMSHFEREKQNSEGFDMEQTDTVITPSSLGVKERLEDHLTSVISRRISKLQNLEKMRVIKNVMHNLYGRHNPIDYKPQFNFQENWQAQSKDPAIDKYEVFSSQKHLFMGLHSALCFLFAFAAWFFSVYRLFGVDSLLVPFLTVILITTLLDAVLKQSVAFEAMNENNQSLAFKDYLRLHWAGLLFLVYVVLLLVEDEILATKNKFVFLFDLCLVWISYQRFKDLYQSIKIKILGSHFRNQIMILQLFGGCILLVHIFGVVLFLISLTDSSLNWTQSIARFSSSWISRYIYSLYFACTTALTVGYGDITPVNLPEIMIVLCVQIIGLINMGYIVNEIGRILSKMSEGQELLHKNISEAEKVTQNCQLPTPLATKMKTYIINNQIACDELNVEEEDNFMRRLNDEIRQEVTSHNHLRIVKSSVFFLCHWSKKFQRHIATKLVRSIYSPQETLPQPHSRQKLYILTKGKLSIEAARDKTSNHYRKTVQTILLDSSKDVQFNTYGYTALVSGLTINLKAVAKDYSICYHVEKEDILSTIVEDESDFHYFHEIKNRIEQSRFKEIWEAPNIANTRQHYLPNPYYVIQRSKNHMLATSHPHQRYFVIRRSARSKWYIQSSQEPSEQEEIDSQQEGSLPSAPKVPGGKCDNLVLTERERQQKYKALQDGERSQYLVTNRKYRRKYPRKIEVDQFNSPQEEAKSKALERFEQFKNFKAFLPKFNFVRISERYHQVFGIKMGETVSCKSGLTKAFQNLGESLIDKLLSIRRVGTGSTKSLS